MSPPARLTALVLAVGVLAAARPALAYRPFVTEDAGVAGAGVAQVEASWDHLRWRQGDTEHALLLVPIYGLTARLEMSAEVPLRILDPEEGRGTAGPGDVTVAGKYLLLEETPRAPALAVKGGVKAASGAARRGLGSDTWDVTLAAVAGKTFAPVTAHAMLGYTVVVGDRDRYQNVHVFGVGADWKLTSALHAVAEVAGNGHPERRAGPDPVSTMVGAIYQPTEKLALDAGVRYGLNDAVPRWTTTLGLTVTY